MKTDKKIIWGGDWYKFQIYVISKFTQGMKSLKMIKRHVDLNHLPC